MKKIVFFSICSFLIQLISVSEITAQVPGQPNFKSIAPPPSGVEKTPSNVSTDLKILYDRHSGNSNNAGLQNRPVQPSMGLEKYFQIRGDKVLVDITVKEDNSKTRADLEKTGFKIFAAYGRVISGIIPIKAIPQLQAVTNIKFARPAYKPMHQYQPEKTLMKRNIEGNIHTPVISQGDTAQRSYIPRNKYKVNGKGVKVGILSDSYNNLGTADIGVKNGELPGPGNPFGLTKPVQVLEDLDSNGIDEGRGMAEIVHDVAPGAEISFHTAFNGQADFAQGIVDLANAGCKVINDDVYYYAEPFFQDGIIAQAVDKVKKMGVTYFSSAGNSGRQSYESNYQASDYAPLGTKYGTAHNFSAPGNAPVYLQPFNIPTFGTAIFSFQWDDPFFSAGGKGAKSDLDIYLIDSEGRIAAWSGEDNIENGDPVEVFGYFNNTLSTSFYVLITKFAGPDPSRLKYIYFGNGSFPWSTPPIPGLYAPTIVGHAKAEGAIATAAAFYLQTPAYASDTPRIEPFSSVGGVPNYFDAEGNRIKPIKRKKPEITAPDGGNTSFFPPSIYFGNQDIREDADTFPNFFGTSAAAPHAAGVAALMIEAQKLGTITPDQIKGILSDNAIDMNNRYSTGFDKGFDYNTGYGFIQADKAVGAVHYPNIYVRNLELEALCSDNPSTVRNWKITNPNPFKVEAHWLLAGFGQEGNLVVYPGKKTFSTKTAYYMNWPVPNVVIIDWKDNLNLAHIDVAYSTSAKCGQDIVSERNSDQRLSGRADAKTTEKPNAVEIFPNPSKKNFRVYLALNNPKNINIMLYSIEGKILYQKTGLSNGVIDIDASNYSPGLYILNVRQGEFNKTFKLIKQ